MTMKCQEDRTQEQVRKFLMDLAYSTAYPYPLTRKSIRDRAAHLLRHLLADAETEERGSIKVDEPSPVFRNRTKARPRPGERVTASDIRSWGICSDHKAWRLLCCSGLCGLFEKGNDDKPHWYWMDE